MSKTINLQDKTWEDLTKLKLELKNKSMDELITYMLLEVKGELNPSKEGDASKSRGGK